MIVWRNRQAAHEQKRRRLCCGRFTTIRNGGESGGWPCVSVMAEIIDVFPRLYPGVLEYVNEAKQKDPQLARDIQRDESYVVFNMICNGFVSSGPMFVATIHDAILKPADAAFVSKVMDERFVTWAFGPPSCKNPHKEKSAGPPASTEATVCPGQTRRPPPGQHPAGILAAAPRPRVVPREVRSVRLWEGHAATDVVSEAVRMLRGG